MANQILSIWFAIVEFVLRF